MDVRGCGFRACHIIAFAFVIFRYAESWKRGSAVSGPYQPQDMDDGADPLFNIGDAASDGFYFVVYFRTGGS